ncbi:GNAT family N-acetyltransferase [Chromobacterium sp. ATCC 53434]|uniref:GNAT family N-acetyltransferase n=1 Tax=Chromobacterium sp. (strain ATCC 53434 / SC 14030) TaxID=2059672 RepID=UPI0013050925|nr:GNAT family N-acetyltransferase [Chromobacterium sp. ATCC 53434]
MLSAALQGERLRLRDFLPSDRDAYLAARRGAAFGRHAQPEQRTEAFSAGLLARFLEQQRQTPRWDWQLAVVRAVDGALIGSVGLRGAAGGEAEFGIELDEAVWRRGYAAEAAALMLAFGRERLGCRRFHARCVPGNVAMLALAMRLGFEMQPLRDGGRLELLLVA